MTPENHESGESPLITIVIPTYNRLAFLQEAVASVVAQSYSRWELIVVDDGSDDGTTRDFICSPDPRISFISLSHTGNIASLRNTGAKAGKGEWLAFLDSDDIWMPEKLEIQIRKLYEEKRRWGYGKFVLMDEQMNPIPNKAGAFYPYSGWIVKELVATTASVNIGSLVVERSFFEELDGFNTDPELLFREDYELTLRLATKAAATVNEELLLKVREHRGRSTTMYGLGHDRTAAVYKYFIQSNPEKELFIMATQRMAYELAESASYHLVRKKYLRGIKQLCRAFINGDSLRHLLSSGKRGFGL
jgi:glycosyltransferase involved in cell wall biosynthesis